MNIICFKEYYSFIRLRCNNAGSALAFKNVRCSVHPTGQWTNQAIPCTMDGDHPLQEGGAVPVMSTKRRGDAS
jgi:hypothetical protein